MIGELVRNGVAPSTLELRADHRRVFTSSCFSTAGVVLPPYVTAFFVRLPEHFEPLLLLPIVLLAVAASIAWLRVRRIGVQLRPDGLLEQRWLPPDRFAPRAEIASVVVLRLIAARTLRTPRQMFVRDGSGRTLLRMRESSWGTEQFDALLGRIAVPAQIIGEPLTIGELRGQRLVTLPWWERSPTARGVAVTAALIAGATALLLPLFQH